MARGDFRSSIGQVISGTQRQVYNTRGTVPSYRTIDKSVNPVAASVLNGISTLVEGYQKGKSKEAAKEKSLDQHIYSKRYKATVNNMSQFIANVAQTQPNDVFLTANQFREKYKDKLATINLEDIEDKDVIELAKVNEDEDLNILLEGARNAVEETAELQKFTSLTDLSANENFEDINDIYEVGKERGLNDTKMFMAFITSAHTAATNGNYEPAMKVKQFAIDKINDPELREKVLSEMETLAYRGQRLKTEYTQEARRAMNSARTIEDVDKVIAKFPEGTFTDDRQERAYKQAEARQYKQSFIDSATADFKNGKVSIDALYSRLTSTQKIDGERTNLEHNIKLSQDEVNEQVNLAFLDLMRENPQAVPSVLKKSQRVPQIVSKAIKTFFQKGMTATDVNDIDFTGNDYRFVIDAINSVDGKTQPMGSASLFVNKYGLEGAQKAVATLMFNQLAYMQANNSINIENAFRSSFQIAFDSVRRQQEMGSMYSEQSYTTALNDALEDDYPPEIRALARNSLSVYKSYMEPEAAAKAALDDAKSLSLEVGDKYIIHGNELMSALEDNNIGILKDYHNVSINDVMDFLDDELDFDSSYATFRPVSSGNGGYNKDFSMLTLADDQGNYITYSLRELEDKVSHEFKDSRYDVVMKVNEKARDEAVENLPLSMKPDSYQPFKF